MSTTYEPLVDANNKYSYPFYVNKKDLLALKVDESITFRFQVSMIRIKILVVRKISLKKTEKAIESGEEHFEFHCYISFPEHISGPAVFKLELLGNTSEYNDKLYLEWGNNTGYSFGKIYSTTASLAKARYETDNITVTLTNHNIHILEVRQQNIIHDRLVSIEKMLLDMKVAMEKGVDGREKGKAE